MAGIPQASGHSHENAAITVSPEGHEGLVQTSKIGAEVALRLLTDPELAAKVKEEHAQWRDYGLEQGLITKEMIRERPQSEPTAFLSACGKPCPGEAPEK